VNPLLARLAGYLQEQANAQREEALRSGKPVYDFGIGDPREPTPEFIRKALREAVLNKGVEAALRDLVRRGRGRFADVYR